jgi:hypothetical protein
MHCTLLFIHKTTLITQIPLVNQLPRRVWPIWIMKYPNGHPATDHWLSIGEKERSIVSKWSTEMNSSAVQLILAPNNTSPPIYPNPHSHIPKLPFSSTKPTFSSTKPPFSYTQTPILIYPNPHSHIPKPPCSNTLQPRRFACATHTNQTIIY